MNEGGIGSNDNNIEAAGTSRPMLETRRKTTFSMSWFEIFEILGKH